MKEDRAFWENRYEEGTTGWDIGYPSPPIIEYALSFPDSTKILIPGGGNGWEAEHLFKAGYKNLYLLDFAIQPLTAFQKRNPDFPSSNLIHENFFEHKEKYDLILEQTFFCALDPGLRKSYVTHMAELLHEGGLLAGLLFNDPLNSDKPPYGGNKSEYLQLFSSAFEILRLDIAHNSIEPRQGRELFFVFRKK